MKLKLDENGNAVVQEGKPVYIHEDGRETPFDAAQAIGKISELNAEAKQHRLDKESALEKLKAFEGIEDPAEALKAMKVVANLDAKKLVDAGELDTLKRQLGESWESRIKDMEKQFGDKLTSKDKELKAKDSQIFNLMVTSQFSKSDYFSGESPKTILPPDVAAEYFGKNFKVEHGKNGETFVVGYIDGERIMSKEKIGDPARFEEAIGVIIDKYPMKERILRGDGGGGPGAAGNTNQQNLGQKVIQKGDMKGFTDNLEAIAKGEVRVVSSG